MPTHFIQKNITGSILGTTQGDAQPGSVASIGWNNTLHGLELNGDGTRHLFKDEDVLAFRIDANSVTGNIFIADKAYTVVGFQSVVSVDGGSGATIDCYHCTGTQAPASGTTVLSAPQSLTGTANTVQIATLTSTIAELSLAAGDRLAFVFAGTLTGLIGCVDVIVRPV